jgi:hypothetical protein
MKACGRCRGGSASKCFDTMTNCSQLSARGRCTEMQIRLNCRKSCRLC